MSIEIQFIVLSIEWMVFFLTIWEKILHETNKNENELKMIK